MERVKRAFYDIKIGTMCRIGQLPETYSSFAPALAKLAFVVGSLVQRRTCFLFS